MRRHDEKGRGYVVDKNSSGFVDDLSEILSMRGMVCCVADRIDVCGIGGGHRARLLRRYGLESVVTAVVHA